VGGQGEWMEIHTNYELVSSQNTIYYIYYSKELKGHCLISCSSQSWGHGRKAVRNAAINAQWLAPIVELYSGKIGLWRAMQFSLWTALLCHPEASEMWSFSVKIAFLFGLSVESLKKKNRISCQNQVGCYLTVSVC